MLASAVPGQEKKTIGLDDLLRSVVPAPNTRAIAARQGVPIGKEALAPAQPGAAPGDSVTGLVQLASLKGDVTPRQWVVRLRMAAGTAGGSHVKKDLTYFTNSGDMFVFHSVVVPMDLETLGPVDPDTEVAADIAPRRGHAQAYADFLTLNLRRSAGVIEKLSAQNAEKKGPDYDISAGPKPYPKAETEATRTNSEAIGINVDDRRSFTGSLPALAQFFEIVRGTPDLQKILLEVVEMPSLIDALRHGGREDIDFEFLGAGPAAIKTLFWGEHGDGEASALLFNIRVFGKPVLMVALIVTDPAPPLEASAGILAAVALAPTKPNKYVAVRIFSSQGGPVAGAASAAN
jgi:hypothetical protein